MVKAVVFDLDGTLLDTFSAIERSMNYTLKKFGFPAASTETIARGIGGGSHAFMLYALPEGNRDEQTVSRCLATYRAYYLENEWSNCAPYAGIPNLLALLKASGKKLGVFTNKTDVTANKIIRNQFPDTFDYILGKRDEFAPKPDAAPALFLLKQLGVTPEETVMVGDGEPDYLAAEKVGMHYAGVLWGYRSKEELAALGGNRFFNDVPSLQRALIENEF